MENYKAALPGSIAERGNGEYSIPVFSIDENGLKETDRIAIRFVKGDRNDDTGPRQDGITTEVLLQLVLKELRSVNTGAMANRHTSIAITDIENALFRIQERQRERVAENKVATMQP